MLRRWKENSWPRRWKIEWLFTWIFHCRCLRVRHEYHAENFQAFVHLGKAIVGVDERG